MIGARSTCPTRVWPRSPCPSAQPGNHSRHVAGINPEQAPARARSSPRAGGFREEQPMRRTTLTILALASIIPATAFPVSHSLAFGPMPGASKPADDALTNVASDDLGVAGVDIAKAGT